MRILFSRLCIINKKNLIFSSPYLFGYLKKTVYCYKIIKVILLD